MHVEKSNHAITLLNLISKSTTLCSRISNQLFGARKYMRQFSCKTSLFQKYLLFHSSKIFTQIKLETFSLSHKYSSLKIDHTACVRNKKTY